MYSRREFTKTALAGVAVSLLPGLTRHAAAIESTVRGVRMGLITGSLNPLPENTGRDPIDVIIEQCLALSAANIELVTVFPQGAPQIVNGGRFGQPPAQRTPEFIKSRQALREWRVALPLDRFREVRAKFDKAGLNLFSYVQTIDDDMTDAEIDAVFRQMQALKVPMFTTNQTRVGMGPRFAAVAESATSKRPGIRTRRCRIRTKSRRRKAWRRCSPCRKRSSSTSTSGITRPATTTPWHSCESITTASPTCTSRIAGGTTVPTCSWAPATRRSRNARR